MNRIDCTANDTQSIYHIYQKWSNMALPDYHSNHLLSIIVKIRLCKLLWIFWNLTFSWPFSKYWIWFGQICYFLILLDKVGTFLYWYQFCHETNRIDCTAHDTQAIYHIYQKWSNMALPGYHINHLLWIIVKIRLCRLRVRMRHYIIIVRSSWYKYFFMWAYHEYWAR